MFSCCRKTEEPGFKPTEQPSVIPKIVNSSTGGKSSVLGSKLGGSITGEAIASLRGINQLQKSSETINKTSDAKDSSKFADERPPRHPGVQSAVSSCKTLERAPSNRTIQFQSPGDEKSPKVETPIVQKISLVEAARRNRQIETQLKKEQMELALKKKSTSVSVILGKVVRNMDDEFIRSGIADAGKSTVTKQMRMSWGGNLSDADRSLFAHIIVGQLAKGVNSITNHIEREYDDRNEPIDEPLLTAIYEFRKGQFEFDSPSVINAFKFIIIHDIFKQYLKRLDEFNLPESMPTFLSDADRFLDPNYVPTDDDILLSRSPTMTITEYQMPLAANIELTIYDVAGDRRQRMKWWTQFLFDSLQVIIYVASLVGFDRPVPEEPDCTQLDESVDTFTNVYRNKLLDPVPLIVLFNKKDLLAKRCTEDGLKMRLPEKQVHYDTFKTNFQREMQTTGQTFTEYEIAVNFVKSEHFKQVKDVKRTGKIMIYETHASDKKQMAAVLAAIRYAFMRQRLGSMGLYRPGGAEGDEMSMEDMV